MKSLVVCTWRPALLIGGYSPTTYRNCGEHWQRFRLPPSRIVALNQHAADLVLALDAGPALVGVAYLDDTDAGQRPTAYFGVPVIARQYPSSEVLVRADNRIW